MSLTRTGGDVVVCGDNNWASSGCPKSLNDALQSVGDEDETITDVTLTESGRWIVLYGRSSARWMGIPPSMERKLRQYNQNNEEIYTATFNDSGDWIVITDTHYSSSAGWITNWLKGGEQKYGELRSACICGPNAVAVFDRGFLFWGNIPEALREALRETDLDVRIIKIAGNAWFFADKYGNYQYWM